MTKIYAPTESHLARAYFELARHGARAIGKKSSWPYRPANLEDLLVICAELCRYDPRLFDIVTEFLFFHWHDINPLKLRQILIPAETPQALLVALSFAASGSDEEELRRMAAYVAGGFAPVPYQLFFRSLYPIAGTNMERAAAEPVREFYEWGFLARERPVIHADGARKTLGTWNLPARRNVILRLIGKRGQLSLKDYLDALDHTISRQQALQDLKSISRLKPTSVGRGSVWKLGHSCQIDKPRKNLSK